MSMVHATCLPRTVSHCCCLLPFHLKHLYTASCLSTKVLSLHTIHSCHTSTRTICTTIPQRAVHAVAMHTMGHNTQAPPTNKHVLRGVVFDMDGTLTVPSMDFTEMRRRLGIMQGDVLEVIAATQDHAQRTHLTEVLRAFEIESLTHMSIMPGVVDLCALLDAHSIPRALLTRNIKDSVDHFHANHFPLAPFSPALSRECHVHKPNPDALLYCCEQWGVQAHEVAIIGDSAKDDIVCGNRAGALTILFDSYAKYRDDQSELQGELRPTFKVDSLEAVIQLLHERFELCGTEQAAQQGVV